MIMTSAVDVSIQAVSPLFIDALLLAWLLVVAVPFATRWRCEPRLEPAPIARMGAWVARVRRRAGPEKDAIRCRRQRAFVPSGRSPRREGPARGYGGRPMCCG